MTQVETNETKTAILRQDDRAALLRVQWACSDTAIYPNIGKNLLYVLCGLVGEAGELANKYKKVLRGGAPMSDSEREAMIGELGDVVWYVSMMCKELNTTLPDVVELMLAKLKSRAERGTLHGSGDNR